MDIAPIPQIKGHMPRKVQKVCGLNLGTWYFPDRESPHNGSIPVNLDAAHIITHKCKARTVNPSMAFPTPAVLGSEERYCIS